MTERAPGRTEENTTRIDQHGQGDGGRDPVEQVAHIRAGARPDRDRQEHDIAGSEAGHRHCADEFRERTIIPPWTGLGEMRPIRSEEHTSELQSLMSISYAVSCSTNNKPHKSTTNHQIATNSQLPQT